MLKYRYKLLIEYDGTEFSGWQIQPAKRTVQAIIQKALSLYTREKIKLIGAGRTDTGVHAIGQVGAFSIEKYFEPSNLLYRINCILPDDISIKKINMVTSDFDPRRDAISRTYRYYIAESPQALLRHTHFQFYRKLDMQLLNKAAELFLGEHDFTSFCRQKSLKDNNRCRVQASRWFRHNGSLIYEITANRFLHNMVRRIVGTLLAAEAAKIDLTQIEAFVNNKGNVRYSAEAKGLVLIKIAYRREKL